MAGDNDLEATGGFKPGDQVTDVIGIGQYPSSSTGEVTAKTMEEFVTDAGSLWRQYEALERGALEVKTKALEQLEALGITDTWSTSRLNTPHDSSLPLDPDIAQIFDEVETEMSKLLRDNPLADSRAEWNKEDPDDDYAPFGMRHVKWFLFPNDDSGRMHRPSQERAGHYAAKAERLEIAAGYIFDGHPSTDYMKDHWPHTIYNLSPSVYVDLEDSVTTLRERASALRGKVAEIERKHDAAVAKELSDPDYTTTSLATLLTAEITHLLGSDRGEEYMRFRRLESDDTTTVGDLKRYLDGLTYSIAFELDEVADLRGGFLEDVNSGLAAEYVSPAK